MADEWIVRGKIRSSSYRKKVLLALEDPLTPSELANRIESINLSHVSRSLQELEELGLVACKNPDARKGRIYALTPFGVKMIESLK